MGVSQQKGSSKGQKGPTEEGSKPCKTGNLLYTAAVTPAPGTQPRAANTKGAEHGTPRAAARRQVTALYDPASFLRRGRVARPGLRIAGPGRAGAPGSLPRPRRRPQPRRTGLAGPPTGPRSHLTAGGPGRGGLRLGRWAGGLAPVPRTRRGLRGSRKLTSSPPLRRSQAASHLPASRRPARRLRGRLRALGRPRPLPQPALEMLQTSSCQPRTAILPLKLGAPGILVVAFTTVFWGKQDSMEKTSNDSGASYYADRQ
ncbi:uncharacterized protein [Manis javanica]|uniref:uncharacterized protein n=1 Tax=Manis javanica TaxID=9974 RepID=UPI003C6DB35A